MAASYLKNCENIEIVGSVDMNANTQWALSCCDFQIKSQVKRSKITETQELRTHLFKEMSKACGTR